MNRDVCEHFNPVDLSCDKCSSANVQKSTLREAAQQALEAMSSFESGTNGLYEGEFAEEISALRAALVEDAMQKFTDVNQELEAALGCDHCNQPLYAAIKCRVCGRETPQR